MCPPACPPNGSARPSPLVAANLSRACLRFYQTLSRRSQFKAIRQDAGLCGRTLLEDTNLIVTRLNGLTDVALARVWLLGPGDICDECHVRAECPNQDRCLHLVASAGSPRDEAHDWNRINGRFRRFPLGVRKVGHIAATREAVEVRDIGDGSKWIMIGVFMVYELIFYLA